MDNAATFKPGLTRLIAGRMWAAWAAVWFIGTLLIFVWPILLTWLIPEPRGVRSFQVISRLWMNLFLYGVGCPIKVYGKQNYDPNQNYVVCANHTSLMDVPLLTPFFPGPNKTIAKKSMSKIPVFGWVYTRGSVLVDRKSDGSRKKSLLDMRKVLLEDNLNMAIYPEGTRNRTGDPLKSFYDGAFRLAADCKKDIIPVIMFGTNKALPAGSGFFLWPSKLKMHVLPPVKHAGKTMETLREETKSVMWTFIEQHAG